MNTIAMAGPTQELNPGFPHDWQEPRYWSHHLLLSKIHIIQMLEYETEQELEPRDPNK